MDDISSCAVTAGLGAQLVLVVELGWFLHLVARHVR